MKVPRDTRRALLAMGAVEFMEAREADEGDGLEATVDPWLAGLLEPLQRAAGPSPAAEPPRASPSGGAGRLGALALSPAGLRKRPWPSVTPRARTPPASPS